MERGTENRTRNRWIAVTCVLLACCLLYALRPGQGAESLPDRVGVVGMLLTALTLVTTAFGVWATQRAGAVVDDVVAARQLSRAVALAEPMSPRVLGGDRVVADVTYSFRPYAHARGAALPLAPAGRLGGLVADYQALRPRRLVITGQPGAGKSVLARSFVAELNKSRADGDPVPVLIALGDWEREESFRDWLVRHLVRDYGRSWKRARQLVDAGLVLPVIDGLDEMDRAEVPLAESRAQSALDALAGYQEGLEPAPLVLTCRTDLYDAFEASGRPMLDAARVEIDPVSAEAAAGFLSRRAGAAYRQVVWAPVLDELRGRPRGMLARSLSTPWRLVLVATAYEQANDPGELLACTTREEVGDTLLGHFIPSSVRAVTGTRSRYAPEDVYAWLGTLACDLQERGGGTDLVLPELARSPGAVWARRLYAVLVGVLALAPVVILMSGGDTDAVMWGLSAFLVVLGAAGLRYLRSGGTGLWGRADFALPPWGSPLWRVGMRLAWSGRGRWAVCVAALWPVLVLWRVAAPQRFGGVENLPMTAAMLFTPALFFVLLTAYFLGSAAVGPSGWPRTGAFFALIVLWPAAIMVLLSRSAGLGPTNDLLVLSMFGSLYCALGGPMAMYTCWLLVNRRRLPFRLSRFLEWSRTAGLIRVTGAAYQFRHREFQEWLTRHPVPARPVPTAHPPAAHPPTRTTTP
ncbi:NACHT domain-containing protein [Streptomyces sp. NPDC057908]|uniref:NACHT domain-containing protein n=1 Tax=Streptomyces sp. NPDC057908 TaxID=3346276 RepID=UPI0036E27A62